MAKNLKKELSSERPRMNSLSVSASSGRMGLMRTPVPSLRVKLLTYLDRSANLLDLGA